MESLVQTVRTAFASLHGSAPVWAWFVPGRVEIFGKHTDYAGGRSLVAAASRGFVVAAAPRRDGVLRAVDAVNGQQVEVTVARDPIAGTQPSTGWRNYVTVVARRLAQNFPGATLGCDVVFASNLPRAAGVSSSSALVVGIATALARRAELVERSEWRAAISSPLDLAGYLGAVESGLGFGSLPGTLGVGIHGGSEDHTAILASQAEFVSAFSYVPVRHLVSERMPPDWTFAILSSGVHAAKAGRARASYNRASDATRALLAIAESDTDQPQTLAALLNSAPDAHTRLRGRIEAMPDTLEAAALARRLDHFIREDGRVLPAAAAFREADQAALGELSRASQEDADLLLGNQVEETRQLTELARACGAFAASSFGAGFGGSVWALVETPDADAFVTRVQPAYRQRFPAIRNDEVFLTRPAGGVAELTDSGVFD